MCHSNFQFKNLAKIVNVRIAKLVDNTVDSVFSGEEGLSASKSLVDIYFKRGGFALHGNVYDAKVLRDAQRNPSKYENLQVRVCGRNAYFNNLPKDQQDAFIVQAKNVS